MSVTNYKQKNLFIDYGVWSVYKGELNLIHAAIFDYFQKLNSSISERAKSRKFGDWLIIDPIKLSQEVEFLNLKPDTIRKKILEMSRVGIIFKKTKRLAGSNRLLIRISKDYSDIMDLSSRGYSSDDIRSLLFPNGFKDRNKSKITPPAKSSRTEILVNSINVPEELSTASGKIVPDNIINYKLIYKEGYKDISYKFIREKVKNNFHPLSNLNPGNQEDESRINILIKYGMKQHPDYQMEEGLFDYIMELAANYEHDSILKYCLLYLEKKGSALFIKSVRDQEFRSFLFRNLKNLKKPKKSIQVSDCPACGAEGYKSYCYRCGLKESWSEEKKADHINELSGVEV